MVLARWPGPGPRRPGARGGRGPLVIDPDRSRVWIDARSSLHPIRSTTDGLEGFVELTLAANGSVDLTRPAAGRVSLPVARLSTGNRMEDRELVKRIEAARYPRIEGVLERLLPAAGEHAYQASGRITFRGVTNAHDGLMTIAADADGSLRLAGHARFDVRTFGLEPPRMLMLKVDPEVDVRVEIVAGAA